MQPHNTKQSSEGSKESNRTVKIALIEALIFASRGADKETIAKLTGFDQEEIAGILEELKNLYNDDNHGIELKEIEGYYRFYTKSQYSDIISKVAKRRNLGNLSPSQLEIAIFLAVRRQATKLEIDSMRGKDSTNLIKQMLISGVIRRRKSGRSFVYSLTDTFKDESMIEELIKQAGGVSFENAWKDIFEPEKSAELPESSELAEPFELEPRERQKATLQNNNDNLKTNDITEDRSNGNW
ncbi:MAG TPA: SMC-Scp complex subunit ScpB [Fervidobacterium sp.]|nr:SMC-Scp complex subunit ScpB [Fervidobacterium sp.]